MYVKLEKTVAYITMLYWLRSPDRLTTIYSWAHLALATHRKAS